MNTRNLYADFNNLSELQLLYLKKAENFARKVMDINDVHGIGHVNRTIDICTLLIKNEGGDPFIVLFSAWLHDIGRKMAKKLNKNHALISAQMALKFIQRECKSVDENTINDVLQCIKSHSFSSGLKQTSIESKILSDADKIDALGSIGIYRASCFQYINGTDINDLIEHFHDKLLILHKQIHTTSAKEIALERTKFMKDFLTRIKNEIII